MAISLVVVHCFGNYTVGDLISDDKEIAVVGQGEHANRVVRVFGPTLIDEQSEDN